MKTEAKVVNRDTARQLAHAGWSEPAEWSWAEIKPGRGTLVRVDRLTLQQRSQYPLYPAPDVSELLEALRQEPGVLELTIDQADVGATLSDTGEWPYQRAGGETAQQALAQLWCTVHVGRTGVA